MEVEVRGAVNAAEARFELWRRRSGLVPVSTPCNAIVYGSGRIPLTAMMRHGIVLDVIGIIVIVTVVAVLGPVVVGRSL
jgi:hypothetical protein